MAEKLEICFCLPTTPEGLSFETPVRGPDYTFLYVMDVPIAFGWPSKQLDENVVKAALIKTLDLFPIACSRVVSKTVGSKSKLVFSNIGSQGAIFEVSRVNQTIPDGNKSSQAWTRHFSRHTSGMSGRPFNRPLLSARLTRFKDGASALCVTFGHVLADGGGLLTFLKTWSNLCGEEINAEKRLPQERQPVPLIDRSEPVGNFTKLPSHETAREDYFATLSCVSKLVYHYFNSEMVDFKFTPEGVAKLKQRMSPSFKESQWVSTFEAVAAAVLRALAIAENEKEMTCRTIVNVRGRTDWAKPEYFGNALSYPVFSFPSKGELGETALAYHDALRIALQNREELSYGHCQAQAWLNEADNPKTIHRLQWLRPFLRAAGRTEPVVNSWVGFGFFDLDFGLNGERPQTLRVGPTFRTSRHVHFFPSNLNGECTLRMLLPAATMEKFKKALKTLQLDRMFTEYAE